MEQVLIAEDSATQRELLHAMLENAGYRVRSARDGVEALKLAGEMRPDLVVTDIVMPNKNGYELCRELKAQPALRGVPVILLTGLADPGDIIAGLQCGADGFIGKPFTEDYMLGRLREILENRALPARETPDGAVRVKSGAEIFTVNASRAQILDLLLSVYHAALRRNHDLQAAERELLKLNRELERKFKDREQLLERERAAREEAERATRLKEEFLATVSHELRTPLSAIAGWVQFLRQGQPSPEEVQEALEVIDRNAWAQTQIVDDLLDMSRIVSGKMRLEVGDADLAAVVRAGVETVQTAATAKGVHLDLRLGPGVSPIRGDSSRLQQVVWNLVNNAVKFTPAGGRVTVSLHASAAATEIRVEDTGAGIEPEFLPLVFNRFSQSDASIRRKHGGLGLGLAIVKHLVELHGGTVRAESEGSGRGARFVVQLPLQPPAIDSAERPEAAPARPAPPTTPAAMSAHRLDQMRFLIVDDDSDARVLMERLLRERGAEVRTAGSAKEAEVALAGERFHVLVSDIGMPGEDGFDLISRVRAHENEELRDLPALALTAFARAQDKAKALAAGFDAYLSKPVDTAALIQQLADLARQRRRRGGRGA